MPKVYALDGLTPVVDPSAYVHPTAVLVGDVIVGPRAYIGPCACLRGDFGRIVVEEGANIQDTCMLHGFPGKDTVVGAEVSVGHGAVLHGCVVRRGALIGMNAVLLHGCVIGEEALVAALSVVPTGMIVPPRTLVAGAPAQIRKELTGESADWVRGSSQHYVELAREYLAQQLQRFER